MERYPHIATVKVSSEGEGLIPDITKNEFTIQGRFEPSIGSGKSIDYSGMFFCNRLEQLKANSTALNGASFSVQGREMKVVEAMNLQTHCEIWLN